jgi:hypothetical protein
MTLETLNNVCCVCGTKVEVGWVGDISCCYDCYETGKLLKLHPELGERCEEKKDNV